MVLTSLSRVCSSPALESPELSYFLLLELRRPTGTNLLLQYRKEKADLSLPKMPGLKASTCSRRTILDNMVSSSGVTGIKLVAAGSAQDGRALLLIFLHKLSLSLLLNNAESARLPNWHAVVISVIMHAPVVLHSHASQAQRYCRRLDDPFLDKAQRLIIIIIVIVKRFLDKYNLVCTGPAQRLIVVISDCIQPYRALHYVKSSVGM